jgi:hypothetical protein
MRGVVYDCYSIIWDDGTVQCSQAREGCSAGHPLPNEEPTERAGTHEDEDENTRRCHLLALLAFCGARIRPPLSTVTLPTVPVGMLNRIGALVTLALATIPVRGLECPSGTCTALPGQDQFFCNHCPGTFCDDFFCKAPRCKLDCSGRSPPPPPSPSPPPETVSRLGGELPKAYAHRLCPSGE